jgi:glucose/arabinose dehydrogenase
MPHVTTRATRTLRNAPPLTALALLLLGLLVCCNEADGKGGTAGSPATAAPRQPAAPSADSAAAAPADPAADEVTNPWGRAEAPQPGTVYNDRKLPLHQIKLPPGFTISLFAEDVPYARELSLSPAGTLFVGSNRANKIYAVLDDDRDFHADRVVTLADNLHLPVGVDFHDGDLYFSEVEGVSRLERVEERIGKPNGPQQIADFPNEEHHGWKFIRFGPDGRLYVPVGVPCNVCDEGDPFGAMLRMNPDGSGETVVFRGMRNTVGFDWHPVTGELWFTDNGRDMLGDNIPPDELNRVPKGSATGENAPHFGFPFWHASGIADPDFKGRALADTIQPVQDLGPHVAALGMRFYTGAQFPAEYRNQIFIAEHGSWNRSTKIGYRVMLVRLNGNDAVSYEPFAEGWKQGEQVWGRPADVEVMPDGSLLVSDDHAGCVYRISYTGG